MARPRKDLSVAESVELGIDPTETPAQSASSLGARTPSQADSLLIEALTAAIKGAQAQTPSSVKKTTTTRKRQTPWSPPPGVARKKLKRRTYHHGIELGSRLSNDEIELCNKLVPGAYCDGFVKVIRRRDKGLDIDYPIRTSSQRLRLTNVYGVTNFESLLKLLVNESITQKRKAAEDALKALQDDFDPSDLDA